MKTIKRTLATILAIVMCFSMSTFAFAADSSTPSENPTTHENLIGEATYLVSNGNMTLMDSNGDTSGIMPLSSVSGYNQRTISGGSGYLYIDCNGQGFGGMGITIQTGCSYGDYPLSFTGVPTIGQSSTISGHMMTNDEIKFNNLQQSSLSEFCVGFKGERDYTPDFFVKVWIYG